MKASAALCLNLSFFCIKRGWPLCFIIIYIYIYVVLIRWKQLLATEPGIRSKSSSSGGRVRNTRKKKVRKEKIDYIGTYAYSDSDSCIQVCVYLLSELQRGESHVQEKHKLYFYNCWNKNYLSTFVFLSALFYHTGFLPQWDSWEPEENLRCPRILREYWRVAAWGKRRQKQWDRSKTEFLTVTISIKRDNFAIKKENKLNNKMLVYLFAAVVIRKYFNCKSRVYHKKSR